MPTPSHDADAAVTRQAAHDAVCTQLAAPVDSVAGSAGRRAVTDTSEHRFARAAVAPPRLEVEFP